MPATAQIIPFAEWRSDMPALGQWAREALNVVPAEESYRPLNELAGVSSPLASRAQAASWLRGTDGDIVVNYPDVYLYGCLVEAAIFTQGEAEARRYLQLYNASVAGLNARSQRITASSVPVIRVRAGRTP